MKLHMLLCAACTWFCYSRFDNDFEMVVGLVAGHFCHLNCSHPFSSTSSKISRLFARRNT